MPKKGRKKDGRMASGGGRKAQDPQDPSALDDGDVADCGRSVETMSIMSTASDTRTDGSEETGSVDESSAQDVLEDKLLECIEGLTQKSVQGRLDCLKSVRCALTKKLLTEFLSNRKMEVADGLCRSILKGKGEEQCSASACAVLLLLHMGSSADSTAAVQELYDCIGQPLRTVASDDSASPQARAACAEALGLFCFLSDQEPQVTADVMSCLEMIFKLSYHKGDGTTRQHSPDVTNLHCSAISAWTLLVTVVPQSIVNTLIQTHVTKLSELLTSPDVELRICAGETIALMYELARDADVDFVPDCEEKLCMALKDLATESNKFRAKKDRKQQRSSFRDILSFVEQDKFTSENIKISVYERLVLDCWTTRIRYNAFCNILRSGMNKHLQENSFLREIFGLGPPLGPGLAAGAAGKMSREDRHFQHDQANRLRTKSRAKQRERKAYSNAASYD